LEQLPEDVEESDLFSAYASDCVYDEREVELRRNWRDIPVKESPPPCSMLYWYPVCYAEGVISKYLQSTNHLGYDASLRYNSRTIFQPAEKTEDLAVKHDGARSVDWTRSHDL